MRHAIIPLCAFGMLVAAGAALAEEKDLSGDYAMEGTSLRPNSRPYSGTCKLARADKVYQINCVNTGSGDKYVGKGIARGGHLSIYLGEYLVVYRAEPDGRLVGNWAHSRSDDYGEEMLTPK